MRDPKRIRKFCNQLADLWESECPDWRFSQLVLNVMEGDVMEGRIPFFIEEDEMMRLFRKYFHKE